MLEMFDHFYLDWRDILDIALVSFLLYQVMLYFLIDASAEKYMFYLPMLLKGAGVSIVYTSLTYALAGCVEEVYVPLTPAGGRIGKGDSVSADVE